MKRILFLFIMSICSFASFAQNQQPVEESDKRRMEIAQTAFGDYERSFVLVEAFHDMRNDLIEVEAFGIGTAEVYIIDGQNQVCEYQILDASISYVTLNAPDTPGHYTLIICSSTYHGEARFSI